MAESGNPKKEKTPYVRQNMYSGVINLKSEHVHTRSGKGGKRAVGPTCMNFSTALFSSSRACSCSQHVASRHDTTRHDKPSICTFIYNVDKWPTLFAALGVCVLFHDTAPAKLSLQVVSACETPMWRRQRGGVLMVFLTLETSFTLLVPAAQNDARWDMSPLSFVSMRNRYIGSLAVELLSPSPESRPFAEWAANMAASVQMKPRPLLDARSALLAVSQDSCVMTMMV